MQKKKIRIIIDTNLWISFLITRKFQVIDKLFDLDAVVFVFSEELIGEFLEVSSRKKFSKYFGKEDISAKRIFRHFLIYWAISAKPAK